MSTTPDTHRGHASLRFTERMTGWFAEHADTFDEGAARGRSSGSTVTFVVTITVDDVDATLRDPATMSTFTGHVDAPLLSSRPLRISNGEFRLMVRNPTEVETLNMRYSMDLEADDGRRFHLDGFKVLRHGPIWRTWHDTTTLHVTVRTGWGSDGPELGRGVMVIKPLDFAKQVSTFRVGGVRGVLRRAAVMARFGRGFFGRLVPLYAGELAEGARFTDEPHAPTRPLRLPAAQRRWCGAGRTWHEGDVPGPDAWLMLTRYRGGDKGPIVLVPGFAMQASSFAPPTIDTNLVEFLVERGYDVWLFDYRASIALPTANTSFDIDQVVTEDWPEAIAEVRRVTGAPTVQALGHCVGSLSALMTVLAGTEGIGALVCSQFTVHPVTSRLNRTKNALHIVDAMHALHVRAMRPDARPTWQNKAMDAALAVVPFPRGERCGSPTCRWLNSIFGLTHHHAQLNDATHESFAEAFGWSNIVGLRHLSLISRKQQAVDATGRDVYLPHVDRVTMPVLFVQGSRNHIFRPAGTQRTVEWLRAHHDPSKIELFEHPDYAHLDMMVGKNASSEVFPRIVEFLDRRQDASTPS